LAHVTHVILFLVSGLGRGPFGEPPGEAAAQGTPPAQGGQPEVPPATGRVPSGRDLMFPCTFIHVITDTDLYV